MFVIGDKNIPLCLECNFKLQHISNMEFLKNATLMNQALDDMDRVTGIYTPGGRMPIQALARAIQASPTLNNFVISQSQIGVLNTGAIQKIDAAITLTKGSDAEIISDRLKEFTEEVIKSKELPDDQKNEVLELTETLADQVVTKRKSATMSAVMNAITEKVSGAANLAAAAKKLWDVIQATFLA